MAFYFHITHIHHSRIRYNLLSNASSPYTKELIDLLIPQVEKAKEQERDRPAVEYTELRREDAEEPIKLGLSLTAKKPEFKPPRPVKNLLTGAARPGSSGSGGGKEADKGGKRKLSALDEIKAFEEQKKEKMNRKDYWLSEVSLHVEHCQMGA